VPAVPLPSVDLTPMEELVLVAPVPAVPLLRPAQPARRPEVGAKWLIWYNVYGARPAE
jgi:hypothetical protein